MHSVLPVPAAPTLELLRWLAERPRTYAETMEAWTSHCPRLTVWEDALAAGLVRVERRDVRVTAAGRALTQARASRATC
jgi:hypothetical protein